MRDCAHWTRARAVAPVRNPDKRRIFDSTSELSCNICRPRKRMIEAHRCRKLTFEERRQVQALLIARCARWVSTASRLGIFTSCRTVCMVRFMSKGASKRTKRGVVIRIAPESTRNTRQPQDTSSGLTQTHPLTRKSSTRQSVGAPLVLMTQLRQIPKNPRGRESHDSGWSEPSSSPTRPSYPIHTLGNPAFLSSSANRSTAAASRRMSCTTLIAKVATPRNAIIMNVMVPMPRGVGCW